MVYWAQVNPSKPLKTNQKLEHFIQLGLIWLLALMPFHAFLSVWLGSLTGQGMIIQAWKEVLILILAGLSVRLVWREPDRLRRLQKPWIYAIGIFAAIAVLVTLATQPPLTLIAFGLKTDLEFLVCAVIAVLVATPELVRRAIQVVLITGAIVGGFAALETTVLPRDFLTNFGYGPNTVDPYLLVSGSEVARFPSTLGGPNQLGTFMILPLCLSLTLLLRKPKLRYVAAGVFGLCLVGLFVSYSRGAWIGAFIALLGTIYLAVEARSRQWFRIGLGIGVIISLLAIPPLVMRSPTLQYYLLHSSLETYDHSNRSDSERAESLADGLAANLEQPLGHGLGTAGPATFHIKAPNIIENQYLQIGYEAGLLGLAAFLAIVMLLAHTIFRQNHLFAPAVACTLIGISLTALVLPVWTDSTTAIVAWTLAGLMAGRQRV
jgi:hypothetical protein